MDAFNATLTRAANWLLGWTASWPPLATLLVWSAVAGFLMAVVFRYTSNQQALKIAADRSRAQVLAIKLYGHDLRAMFAALGQLLRYTGLRLWYSLPPMLVMLVPFVLLLVQLGLRYEYRPLAVGEAAIVKLELTEKNWPANQNVTLQPPPQIALETPGLRDPQEHAIYWRVRAKGAAPAALRWRVGEQDIEKRIDVNYQPERLATVSARRPGRDFWDRLLHPAEPAIAADIPVEGIDIAYPPRETHLLGINIPWWLTFLLISILAALLAKPIVKVRY